jgi:hypothetical protein
LNAAETDGVSPFPGPVRIISILRARAVESKSHENKGSEPNRERARWYLNLYGFRTYAEKAEIEGK